MHLDGAQRDEQRLGDLAVAHALGGQPRDAQLAGGQRVDAGAHDAARPRARRDELRRVRARPAVVRRSGARAPCPRAAARARRPACRARRMRRPELDERAGVLERARPSSRASARSRAAATARSPRSTQPERAQRDAERARRRPSGARARPPRARERARARLRVVVAAARAPGRSGRRTSPGSTDATARRGARAPRSRRSPRRGDPARAAAEPRACRTKFARKCSAISPSRPASASAARRLLELARLDERLDEHGDRHDASDEADLAAGVDRDAGVADRLPELALPEPQHRRATGRRARRPAPSRGGGPRRGPSATIRSTSVELVGERQRVGDRVPERARARSGPRRSPPSTSAPAPLAHPLRALERTAARSMRERGQVRALAAACSPSGSDPARPGRGGRRARIARRHGRVQEALALERQGELGVAASPSSVERLLEHRDAPRRSAPRRRAPTRGRGRRGRARRGSSVERTRLARGGRRRHRLPDRELGFAELVQQRGRARVGGGSRSARRR